MKKIVFYIAEHRYEKKDLEGVSAQWAEELKQALQNLPEDWMDVTFNKLANHNKPNETGN